MKKGIYGKKLGMTQVFTQNGLVIPVTVIEAGPCVVTQKKTIENDGYNAVQVAFDVIKENKLNKPILGIFKKANVTPTRYLRELRIDKVNEFEVGSKILCTIFEPGDKVDVSGVSKGHGFTGTIKRWNAGRLRMSHGAGPCHRLTGSLGASSTPARVMKNTTMPGQDGNENVTVQSLEVIKVDEVRNIILVKGAIPGAKGGLVCIRDAVKVSKEK